MSNDHAFRGKHRQHRRRPDLRPDERVGLAAFVERLRQRYGEDLLRVVLFGSRARGDFDAESDVDVLVVLRGGEHWQRLAEISEAHSKSPAHRATISVRLTCREPSGLCEIATHAMAQQLMLDFCHQEGKIGTGEAQPWRWDAVVFDVGRY